MRKLLVLILLSLLIGCGIYYFLYYKEKEKKKDHLTLFGNVDVRQVDLGFRVFGRVAEMPWQEGDLVTAGTLMATLDKQPYADQVEQAVANVEANKAQLTNAEMILKRREELRVGGGVSQEDYDNSLASFNIYTANRKQVEAALGVATTSLNDTEIYAPNDGTILTRIREPGTIVREADPVYTLSLISPVWIRTFIAEPDLGLIYPGMEAEIYTDTYNGKVYKGHIGFISPVAEFTPKTVETTQLRTDLVYRLRVIADNPDNGLRQGMPVTVRLSLKNHEDKKASE
ncbi:MAG: efflux RND transporter periplasmic adaptor subunit [Parachlamydiaceae bacterium]|nr:efflux RND transporter periplasmic adaptor subunit [Parachlamydiaceae bacterium]